MGVVEFSADKLSSLAASYRSAAANIPHCYPADGTEADWAAELATLGDEDGSTHRRILLAEGPNGAVLGFVDVCVWERHTGNVWGAGSTHTITEIPERGLIRFLWYEPGERAAGEALLDAAEAHLRACGVGEATAFDQDFRYPWYMMSSAYFSLRANHVHSLLEARGYERCGGECYYDWQDYEIDDDLAPLPPGLTFRVEQLEGEGLLPGTATYAVDENGEDLGVCVTESGGNYSRDPAASDIAFTTWLGVPVRNTDTRLHPSQGKGLGKTLLAESLRMMKKLGYKHAAISTALYNHRAQLFYSNMGYELTDWTYSLQRVLDPAPRL